MLRISISIAVVTAVSLSLYLWIALPLLQQPQDSEPSATTEIQAPATPQAEDSGRTDVIRQKPESIPRPQHNPGSRLVEIYGRIIDSQGQPIDNVLVTEERYFYANTSDANGQYRILLDLPQQRSSTLKFLRAGFAAKRVTLSQPQLQQLPVIELDITLARRADTLSLPGRVVSDLGVGLEGARIDISAYGSGDASNFYLTVFSDELGNFVLEGVPASTKYKLIAMLAPEFPLYTDPDFFVGIDPRAVDIQLQSLKFVNLSGMIVNPEAAPVADFEFFITNVSTGVHARQIVSDSSGFFTLENFPLGEVSLTTRGAEFHKITGLELTEDSYASLQLIVDRGDRYLSGWVSDENGIAVQKAMVTLDTSLRNAGMEYVSYRSQTTDESGRFGFENLARGEHRISVYANGYNKLERRHGLQNQSAQVQLRLTRNP